MKHGILKAIGHNVADSLASGIGLMIGVYEMSVFAEAAGEEEGFVSVDFLKGSTTGRNVSASFRKAVELYGEALPRLCGKHSVDLSEFKALEVRYGTDAVYGPHFTVTVEGKTGKRSTEQYVGIPGRRLRRRRRLLAQEAERRNVRGDA
jgi:hypothetical protein